MPTINYTIPASGHALAATLREIDDEGGGAVRIELKPQTPFAGDAEFDTNLDLLAAPGDWTVTNGVNADSILANSSVKSQLVIDPSVTDAYWDNATRTGVFVWQTLSGDFDIYSAIAFGDLRSYHSCGLLAQSTSDADDWVNLNAYFDTAGANPKFVIQRATTVNAVTTASVVRPTKQRLAGGHVFIRLKRSGNDFSMYYSFDGFTWTQIGTTVTRNDFSENARVGPLGGHNNTADFQIISWDFLRTWPPYVTTSPVGSVVIDSGVAGTVWDMSTFNALVNMYQEYNPQSQIGFGTLKYKYGASDTNPPSLNASYLTEAQMQAEADPRGRYFKLEVQYTSANGYEQASFNGAIIDGTFAARRPALRLVSA